MTYAAALFISCLALTIATSVFLQTYKCGERYASEKFKVRVESFENLEVCAYINKIESL